MTSNITPTKTELFDPTNPQQQDTGGPLVYYGGPMITNVEVFTVFLGQWWNTQSTIVNALNVFFDDILTSELMDQLAEYSVDGYPIGHGKRTGTVTLAGINETSLTDADIQVYLNDYIQDGTLPQPNANTVYFVYLPSGATITQQGDRSCDVFCGYHSSQGQVLYSVLTYPDCNGCLGGESVFDALTETSSHELSEVITNFNNGWSDANGQEIGDKCAWQKKSVTTIGGTFTVQQEWSNANNACM